MSDTWQDDLYTVGEVPQDKSPFRDAPDVATVSPDVKSKPETELIIKGLTRWYALIATGVAIIDKQDAMVIMTNAEDLAESWRELLDNDAKLRKRMKGMFEASGWGNVIFAHVVIGAPILAHHGLSLDHLFQRKPKNDEKSD